jgi:hypothetical protein
LNDSSLGPKHCTVGLIAWKWRLIKLDSDELIILGLLKQVKSFNCI